jgi:2-dehydro-3-deoxyphosphogluconate aldolase/(4S)-4-hydroxy-2-oxoglutarate aldolase
MDRKELRARLAEAAIMPIITVRAVDKALADITRLIEEGVGAIEIVFRTAEAATALAEARRRFPKSLIGAGTMLRAEQVTQAVEAGADFLVSPGLTPKLHAVVAASGRPMIPGVLTASEVLAATEYGYDLMKYYPAQPSNGLMVLADYANIFTDVGFVPTGKIDASVLGQYGALRNVVAVGGSWMLGDRAGSPIGEQIAAFRKAKG